MASGGFQTGFMKLLDGTNTWLSSTIKMLLVATATPFTYDPDVKLLDAGGANDITDAELNVAGYTRGFGGAGRKTLASKTISVNDANNRIEMDCADITWTALGAGQTIAAGVTCVELTNDGATAPIGYHDPTDVPTNGGDITMQIASNGLFNLNM